MVVLRCTIFLSTAYCLHLLTDFDIDGAVVKVNNVQIQQVLGQGPRSPKWALAHKFTAEEAETELVRMALKYFHRP
jgi:DNA ligase (NAD+)